MILFALGLGVASVLLASQLVKALDVADKCGCSFRDALWLLDQK
jgi:hypothetical protein